MDELIARIKAIFRRQARLATHDDTFEVGGWTIDARKHVMQRGRTVQRLTFYELELLKLLRHVPTQSLEGPEIGAVVRSVSAGYSEPWQQTQ